LNEDPEEGSVGRKKGRKRTSVGEKRRRGGGFGTNPTKALWAREK